MCHIRLVLLCSGKGADASSYFPNRDESQWWNRRDALVRCVSAFLFAPTGTLEQDQWKKRELVFVFDEDFSRIHMSIDDPESLSTPPTEQRLISLWKDAASRLNVPIRRDGLCCQIFFDPLLASTANKAKSNSSEKSRPKKESNPSSADLPSGLNSKRQLLDYLQQHCSIAFLRENGLNSSASVILRKTNQKSLLKVWENWKIYQSNKQSSGSSEGDGSSKAMSPMQHIFDGLLQAPSSLSENMDVVAGTLHEKFEELPCFGADDDAELSNNLKQTFLCVFLGAVRDMTDSEYQALEHACQRHHRKMIGIRLGKVPEFTSKILSVLAFHQAQGMLDVAIRRLCKAKLNPKVTDERILKSSCLHLICAVPIPSTKLSNQLSDRNWIHWCLVRIVVNTLWRSKMVSSSKDASVHKNSLALLFDDGVAMYLGEEEFVSEMAEQHQAAPSEYQILTALLKRIRVCKVPEDGSWSYKKMAALWIDKMMASSPISVKCTIGVNNHSANSHLVENFYSLHNGTHHVDSFIAIIDIDSFRKGRMEKKKERKIYRALLRASTKKNRLPTMEQSLVDLSGLSVSDAAASSIIALQHFCYQNRAFLPMDSSDSSLKKRKRE